MHQKMLLIITLWLAGHSTKAQSALLDSLVDGAWRGNFRQVAECADQGAELDQPNAYGLNAWQAARLTGRTGMMPWMKARDIDTLQPMPEPEAISDWLFRALAGRNLPGAAVLLAEGKTVRYRKDFGLAVVSPPKEVEPKTIFRIGSVTKQFTAAAILKLAEAGKLSLEDPLSRWLPDFPRAKTITIRQLLNHTSGIHPYTEQPGFLSGIAEPIDPAALLDSISTYRADFKAGRGWKYNNSGYFILGYLIEQISGKPYGTYLKDVFFQPLGMRQTGLYDNRNAPSGEAKGYSAAGGKVELALDWDMSWAGGAGALYSTVDDLHTWNLALHQGKVLSEASYRAMITPYSYADGKLSENGQGYGYGLAIGQYRGEPIYGHSGGLHGFTSFLAYLPEREATLVVLTNASPNEYIVPEEKAMELVSAWYGMELGPQRTVGSPHIQRSNPLEVYEGTYEYPRGQILRISRKEGALMAQLTGQGAMEIVPVTIDSFQWVQVEASARFHRAPSGQIRALTHYQGGQQFEAPKFEFPETVAMDTTAFDLLAGTYDLGGSELRVFRKGVEYFAQLSGQPPFPVFPQSENELFLKVARASLRFEREGDGPASAVVLEQGGNAQRAVRKD